MPPFRDLNRLSHELRPRVWIDRLLIWSAAVVAGLAVVGFAILTEHGGDWFAALRSHYFWAPLVVMPLGGATIVWLTQRFVPGAAGSGIPQVMAALNPELPADKCSHLVSLRLVLGKIVLGSAALLSGFSVGREGPSVQIAAGVMRSFHRWVRHKPLIKEQDLILAGGAAGIAAAFNAPLAGIVFAIEELSKRFEQRSSGLIITAIVIAGMVGISTMGNLSYFGRVPSSALFVELLLPGLLVTLCAGLLGGVFARLLIYSFRNRTVPINRWRSRHPIGFAATCGLAVAALGVVGTGGAFGSGYEASQQLLAGEGNVSMFYFAEKFVATWLSFWSGIPGGIFAPSLAIGAGIGQDVALLTAMPGNTTLIALGMAGFLAAATQAPITSFIIVMEMTEGHNMVLSLMATALLASGISRLISEPLYPALASLHIKRHTGG